MKIEQLEQDSVTIVALRGRFDAPAAPEAEQAFSTALQEGARNLLVDLSGVEYISSGGIRVIIMLSKSLEECRGTLKLCGLTPFVQEVLDITHLSSRFDIYPSREDAVRAFQAGHAT